MPKHTVWGRLDKTARLQQSARLDCLSTLESDALKQNSIAICLPPPPPKVGAPLAILYDDHDDYDDAHGDDCDDDDAEVTMTMMMLMMTIMTR